MNAGGRSRQDRCLGNITKENEKKWLEAGGVEENKENKEKEVILDGYRFPSELICFVERYGFAVIRKAEDGRKGKKGNEE